MHSPPNDSLTVTRRQTLRYGGLLTVIPVAGCLNDSDTDVPEPIALDDQNQCEICGMVIADYPGPNGQIYYAGNTPDTHDNPAWFDSVMGCMFPYYFDQRSLGWEVKAAYVTDYSIIDWEISSIRGQEYISSTVSADSFTNGFDAFYVAESGIHGAMGPELIPFSNEGDANDFAIDHDGKMLSFDEITPSVIQNAGSDSHY